MDAIASPKVALVHDWLTGMRGGEKCLEMLCRTWPLADLFTLFHLPGQLSDPIERMAIKTSYLQKVPGIAHLYRHLLPLMPGAIRSFRMENYDLVVSLSHCVAKGVSIPPGTPHVCYCFTPMRYIWHMREAYVRSAGMWKQFALAAFIRRLQNWDRATAAGVTHFIAISETVRNRIRECYDRESVVIYPPVDTSFFTPSMARRGEYYLVVSALVPYKRIDLAIAACNALRRKLVIIGTGPEETQLRSLAGPTVEFLGWQTDKQIRDHLRQCRALLFPGEEDFGIVPVEAQACGAPVVAFGRGGATETVVPLGHGAESTGSWFQEQSPESLSYCLEEFEALAGDISPLACRQQALRFNSQRFEVELTAYIRGVLGGSRASVQLRAA